MDTKPNRYSPEELQEFEEIILEKLQKMYYELEVTKKTLSKEEDNSVTVHEKFFEDNAEATEKEILSRIAERQQKYIIQLENALVRIKNGTYGVCERTGKLINKARLKAVPNTRYCITTKVTNT